MYELFKNNIKSFKKNRISFISIFLIIFLNAVLFSLLSNWIESIKFEFSTYSQQTYMHNFQIKNDELVWKKGPNQNQTLASNQFISWFENQKKSNLKNWDFSENFQINLSASAKINNTTKLSYFNFINYTGDLANDSKFQTYNNNKIDLIRTKDVQSYFNKEDNPTYFQGNIGDNKVISVLVDQLWAKYNNLGIGSQFSFQGLTFEIAGYAQPPNFISKNLSLNLGQNRSNYTFLVLNFGSEKALGLEKIEQNVNKLYNYLSTSYVTKSTYYSFIDKTLPIVNLNNNLINKVYQQKYQLFNEWFRWKDTNKSNDQSIDILINSRRDEVSVSSFISLLESTIFFRDFFSFSLTIIATLITIITLRKVILSSRGEIGILKAMGYKAGSIALNFTSLVGLIAIIAGFFGTIIGFLLQPILSNNANDQFIFSIPSFGADPIVFMIGSFFSLITLVIFAYFFNLIYTKQTIIKLINPGIKNNLQLFSSIVPTRAPFYIKLWAKTMNKSISKLSILFIGTFFSSTLIILAFSISDVILNSLLLGLKPLNFNYSISFDQDLAKKGPLVMDSDYYKTGNDFSYYKYYEDNTNDIWFSANNFDTVSKNISLQWIENLATFLEDPSKEQQVVDYFEKYLIPNQMKGLFLTSTTIQNQKPLLNKTNLNIAKTELDKIKQLSIVQSNPELKIAIESLSNNINLIDDNFDTTSNNTFLNINFALYNKTNAMPFYQTQNLINTKQGKSSFDIDAFDNSSNISQYIQTLNASKLNKLNPNENGIYLNNWALNKYHYKKGEYIFINNQKCQIEGGVNAYSADTIFTSAKIYKNIFNLNNAPNPNPYNSILFKQNPLNPDLAYYLKHNFIISLENDGNAQNPNYWKINPATKSFFSKKDSEVVIDEIISLTQLVLTIGVILFILIAVVIMMSTIILIIFDNKLFMSIIKVLGYSNGQINKLFSFIYMPSLIIAIGASFPLGIFLKTFLVKQIASIFNLGIASEISIFNFFVSLSTLLLIIIISFWFSMSSIKHISLGEAMNSKNN